MVFLESVVDIADRFGMLPALHKKSPWYILLTIINCIALTSIGLHTTCFYFENLDDFEQSTFAIGSITYVVMLQIECYLLLAKNQKFVNLYFKMKRLYDDPLRYDSEIKGAIEKRLTFYNWFYVRFLCSAGIFVISTPLMAKATEYYKTGAMEVSQWDLPFTYSVHSIT